MKVSVLGFCLGCVPYNIAWDLQKSIVKLLKSLDNPSVHCILLLEHCPVYTIGIRHTDPMNDYGEHAIKNLKRLGAEFVRSVMFFLLIIIMCLPKISIADKE